MSPIGAQAVVAERVSCTVKLEVYSSQLLIVIDQVVGQEVSIQVTLVVQYQVTHAGVITYPVYGQLFETTIELFEFVISANQVRLYPLIQSAFILNVTDELVRPVGSIEIVHCAAVLSTVIPFDSSD
jgi:hypothetical protein